MGTLRFRQAGGWAPPTIAGVVRGALPFENWAIISRADGQCHTNHTSMDEWNRGRGLRPLHVLHGVLSRSKIW